MEKNMNMEMVRYKVMETGDKVGYIEFVDNSEVIGSVHKWRGFLQGPFKERSIYEYFKQEIYPLHLKLNIKKIKEEQEKSKKKKSSKNMVNLND